jgi:ribosomal protein L37AE/L43A
MNRVQFQPGLSTAEFFHRYGTDTLCEAALIQSRWPTGFVCPDCGCAVHSAFRRTGRLHWQCSACRHPCSVTSGISPGCLLQDRLAGQAQGDAGHVPA